jgi:hypothetical protein
MKGLYIRLGFGLPACLAVSVVVSAAIDFDSGEEVEGLREGAKAVRFDEVILEELKVRRRGASCIDDVKRSVGFVAGKPNFKGKLTTVDIPIIERANKIQSPVPNKVVGNLPVELNRVACTGNCPSGHNNWWNIADARGLDYALRTHWLDLKIGRSSLGDGDFKDNLRSCFDSPIRSGPLGRPSSGKLSTADT